MRTYQIAAGKTGEFLGIYEREGLGIISQYARLEGCWTKDSGTLNSIVFCWGYEDYAHRAAQRVKLAADPRWQASRRAFCRISSIRNRCSCRRCRFARWTEVSDEFSGRVWPRVPRTG
ncbi:NIPSNAP family protein [Paraburkholderia sp. BL6665CI2N2]|uniref:NIPSNAP family protein n=1 Tax=Paraburkholderia sp. BL6665CI2N2 TaxID=1938806 RepID=UPI001FB8AA40|nr:NIPSNAP family protein [Paraburkholderia sp. BL6665CI2N2]